MARCTGCGALFMRRPLVVGAGLAWAAISSCSSGSASKQAESAADTAQSPPGAAQAAAGPGIDLDCVMDHIQNPAEAFHYSFRRESSNPLREDADITPTTIDGTFQNSSASRSFQGVRSDSASWQAAWSSLMGIGSMSSAMALVSNTSATVLQGPEPVNGYQATKYSIDTGTGTATEKSLWEQTLGMGGFERGTVWVTADGCPVKLVMDSEVHARDGSVETIHYAEGMTRK